jgi:hypothetical protein
MKGLLKPNLIISLVAVVMLAGAIVGPLAGSIIRAHAQSSTVSINPTQGPVGAPVTGSGTNWTAGDQMQVTWDDGTILANTTVQSDGTFTVNFNIPSSAGLGGHDIYFTDLSSRYFLVAVFTVGTVDLQTLRIVALQTLAAGTSPTFRAYIRNNGTVASGFFNIQWIADGTNFYGGHYSIPAGAVDTHDHIWSNITSGKHTLTFIANFDHLVPETNYNNNKVTITFMVNGWGVDSYKHITQSVPGYATLYDNVTAVYGAPDFWGRYIGNDPVDYPNDMDLTEPPFAHKNNFAILPIYFNYAANAVNGYSTGQAYATAAIMDAQRRLKITKGIAIFNDIEEAAGVNPDAQFIQGWYDRFNSTFTYTYNGNSYTYQAGYYKAGYYGNGTSTSRFATAYCSAVKTESSIGKNSFIWSSEPSGSRTSKKNAPPYAPYTPSCKNQTLAWQYAIQDSHGPPDVDTDEVNGILPLWYP